MMYTIATIHSATIPHSFTQLARVSAYNNMHLAPPPPTLAPVKIRSADTAEPHRLDTITITCAQKVGVFPHM